MTHLLLVGEGGRVLARISSGEQSDLNLVWPDSAFKALVSHGVALQSVAYADRRAFQAAHPRGGAR